MNVMKAAGDCCRHRTRPLRAGPGRAPMSASSFIDYLFSIVGWERFRASQFGIHHDCTIGLNSKEANNEALAEVVLDILPRYLSKEGVVAVGETRLRLPDRARYGTTVRSCSWHGELDMLVTGAHPPSRQEGRHGAQHGSRDRDGHGAGQGHHRPQQRGNRARRARLGLPASRRRIRRPRWATT